MRKRRDAALACATIAGLPRSGRPRGLPAGVRRLLFAGAFGAVAAVTVFLRVFVPGAIGLADDGDGRRLMCGLRLAQTALPGVHPHFYYAMFRYSWLRAHSRCQHYPSSETLLLEIARPLSRLMGLPGAFDLRALACVGIALVALATTLFADALRAARIPVRLLVVALFLVVACEATFVDYFASPYSELAGIIGIQLMLACGVQLHTARGRARCAALTGFVLAAALTIAAKTQTATLFLPVALFLGSVRVPCGRLRGRLAPLVAAVVLLAPTCWVFEATPADDKLIDPTEVVFTDLLGPSAHPAADLREMGLPTGLARYAGTNWWSSHAVESDPLFASARHMIGYPMITRFLLRNPGRGYWMMKRGAEAYLDFRPGYLGTYPSNAGPPPRTVECRDCLLSTISRDLAGARVPTSEAPPPFRAEPVGYLLGVLGYWLACATAGLAVLRRSVPDGARRGLGAVALLLVGIAVDQFLTAVFGEAIENTKHLVFSLAAASLAPVVLLAGALVRDGAARDSGRHDVTPDPVEPVVPAARRRPGALVTGAAGAVPRPRRRQPSRTRRR